jgi:hypothetical protein
MSRHRFVRNLDLDGELFPYTNLALHRAPSSADERDDGALSDGGDDMTPEQYGMGIILPVASLTALFAYQPAFQRKWKPGSRASVPYLAQKSNPDLRILTLERACGTATLMSKRRLNA